MSCCYEKDKSYKTDKMKKEVIQELYNGFEAVAVEVEGIECWSARELQLLLGYSKWENFSKVIDKAKLPVKMQGVWFLTIFLTSGKWLILVLGQKERLMTEKCLCKLSIIHIIMSIMIKQKLKKHHCLPETATNTLETVIKQCE